MMCFVDEDELPMDSLFFDDVRKARKDHKCFECCKVIPKGSEYHYLHGVSDGVGWSEKVCIRCEKIRAAIHKKVNKRQRYRSVVPIGELQCCIDEMKRPG